MIFTGREVPNGGAVPSVGLSWWMTDNSLLEKLGLLTLIKNDIAGQGYNDDDDVA